MSLRHRALEPEYFDSPERTAEQIQESYRWLRRVNRLTRFERPFLLWIPRLLGPFRCRQLSLLDLGAGEGLLGRTLENWARARRWDWRFTSLDLIPPAPHSSIPQPFVVGTALALPFLDESFDVVVATTMTHHLQTDADVVRHFKEAWRVTRRALLICDLHRGPLFYGALWLLLRMLPCPPAFRSDGLLSVRRGWRAPEWQRLARLAEIDAARVWTEHGARILLSAVRPVRENDP